MPPRRVALQLWSPRAFHGRRSGGPSSKHQPKGKREMLWISRHPSIHPSSPASRRFLDSGVGRWAPTARVVPTRSSIPAAVTNNGVISPYKSPAGNEGRAIYITGAGAADKHPWQSRARAPPYTTTHSSRSGPIMASLTVPPVPTWPRQDAIDLHKAFKGFGCDSTTVINILAHRDATQRAAIQQEHRAVFNQDLSRRVASELSGHHKRAMLLWILDPASRDATILKQALTGDVTDLRAATEVICSRTPSQLQIVRHTYRARFGCYVEHDVTERTSGDHQRLLLAYLAIPRPEGAAGVDPSLAALDARELYKAGERRLGTDERAFIRVFSERSWAHLAAVARAYHHMYDRSLEQAVKGETSGNFGFGLLTVIRCAADGGPARYFAKVLHKAMKGIGTSDSALIRVVVTRAEVDMQYIKAEYHRMYKRSLADAIHSETSGNYRTFLLSLVGRDRTY